MTADPRDMSRAPCGLGVVPRVALGAAGVTLAAVAWLTLGAWSRAWEALR